MPFELRLSSELLNTVRNYWMSDRFDAMTAWTVGGAVTTVWLGLLGLLLSLNADLEGWVTSNSSWLIPLLLASIPLLTGLLGFLAYAFISPRSTQTLNDGQMDDSLDLVGMWARESKARVVWIVSPYLYYDVLNPSCRNVVARNLSRNVQYAYIVADSELTRSRMAEYQKHFGISDAVAKKIFLTLPESELAEFISEIVMYDPHLDRRAAYGYPHASGIAAPDVLEFTPGSTDHFIQKFQELWMDKMLTSAPTAD